MTEQAARALLAERGAGTVPHPGGTLAAHLDRVHATLTAWGARPELRLAGLCHAFYGTDGFPRALGRRDELAPVIGPDAEALVYFYASCDRAFSYPRLVDGGTFRDRFTGAVSVPDTAARRDFAELTVANELDVLRHADFDGAELLALFAAWTPLLGEDARRAVSRAAW
ncbi:hypothetical protein BTM25_12410 [Actinomadura rubteroloni]|uniref:DUF6817 domain-containing protein n=1 Tax=Actinomadura rubteroloni TaxID=1926885 RepID=A0A2P4UP70_9ACTN|nr:hypothetical protein [Actinomadura rubteroloni]POM26833.1 hypothetical protein BTM25_12410 [Actinomadura rubteroloni]